MKLVSSAFLFSALGLCLPAAFAANSGLATPTPQKTKAPQISYQELKLANGLQVLLHEDHKLPIVSIDIWYHVGPVKERAGRTGFAHLFEHMMF